MKRSSLSLKLRFEVFKRDNFTCQYCGNSIPKVVLEVDHIHPVSKGGKNNSDNLITSCFDCNRGKSNNELTEIIPSLSEKTSIIKEKELQYKHFIKAQQEVEARIAEEINNIDNTFTKYFAGYQLNELFKNSSLKNFISKIGYIQVKENLLEAISRTNESEHAIKYFCAICWRQIKS